MTSVTSVLRQVVRFARLHGMGVFRSALFLASVMVLLEHFYVLEWLDAFMLRVLPAVAQHTSNVDPAVPTKALVFTIQEELFETEFKSRSPIERSVLLQYLRKLADVYDKFKVLAIDYDLSPNNLDPTESEQAAQAELETFLLGLIAKGKKVVLIRHLPVTSRKLCELKINWEKEQYEKGILFGQSELLHYRLFGTVVKYVDREDSFPAIIRTAAEGDGLPDMRAYFTCPDPQPSSGLYLGDTRIQLINFLEAVGPVKVCRLNELNGFDDCDLDFSKWTGNVKWTDDVKVIFFGGQYGKDDTYVTPLGDLPGVTVQAYTYFSKVKPAKQRPGWAWIIDIGMGFFAGLIFEQIWRMFHNYHQKGRLALPVALTLGNFVFLIFILGLLVSLFASWLAKGIWINPAPMFIGLFIHSYMAAATATGQQRACGIHAAGGFTAFLYKLIGIPGCYASVWDCLCHWSLKVGIFWITVGMAISRLWTHH